VADFVVEVMLEGVWAGVWIFETEVVSRQLHAERQF